MLESSAQKFKVTMSNMVRALRDKVDSIHGPGKANGENPKKGPKKKCYTSKSLSRFIISIFISKCPH